MSASFKFKHLYGEQMPDAWKNVKPSEQIYETNILKVNQKFIGYFPDKVGGIINVFDYRKVSHLSDSTPCILGHEGSFFDFEFMPFRNNYLATAGNDSKVNIWKIPDEITANITKPEASMEGHHGKCILLAFNQAAEGILASTAYDRQVCIWDIQKNCNLYGITGSDKDFCTSMNWNSDGSLLTSAWKDKYLRVIDPRSKSIPIQILSHEGMKSQKTTWMGQFKDLITTVGYTAQHQREIKLWDTKKPNQPLQQIKIDNLSGVLHPFYDQDLNILFLSAKGETSIKYYEFYEHSYVYFQNDYKGGAQSKASLPRGVSFSPRLSRPLTLFLLCFALWS